MLLMTRTEMAAAWGMAESLISQVTKDVAPVDFRGYGIHRKGLYRPGEIAEVIAEDAENKRRRAMEAVEFYEDRLEKLAPYLTGEDG